MKNMRIPIFSAMGVAILGVIFGSFFDYQISSAIASATSTFGLTVSVIGPTIGFCGLTFVGGGLAALAMKEKLMWKKCIFFALAVIAVFVTVYYAGREYFGINGFDKKAPEVVGMLIAGVCGIAAEVGGYYVFKNCEDKTAWIPFVLVYAVLLLVLVAAIPILKDTMHRPRYRTVLDQSIVPFHNWYEKCGDYKYYMETYNIGGEEFKSFPSGHTGEAAILIVIAAFAPLANEKIKKYQLPLFICACVFVAFVGLGRITAAAHYLSDVSMGALLTLIFTCIANEALIFIYSKIKKPEAMPEVAQEEQKDEVAEAPIEESK